MSSKIGDILSQLRTTEKVTQAELCRGICSASEIVKIEGNQKTPDPFLLDRLFERLGKATDRLKYVLSAKLYELYELQYRIQTQILDKDFNGAAELLERYRYHPKAKSNIHRQFILQEYAQIAWLKGERRETVLQYLIQAIAETIPEEEVQECILSAEEVRLLLFRWEVCRGTTLERPSSEIWDCLQYIKKRGYEDKELVKVYPYAVLLLQDICEDKWKQAYYEECLNDAFELLQREEKILYLPEILQVCIDLAGKDEKGAKKAALFGRMKEALLDLELEYGLYFEGFRLFRHLNRSFKLDYEMIRHNRIACNMTMEQLCDGICSWEEISRIERGICKPNDQTLTALLDRMNRKQERVEGYLVTEDFAVMELEAEMVRAEHYFEDNKVKELLTELEQKLDIKNIGNLQYLQRLKIRMQYIFEQLPYEQAIEELYQTLHMTMEGSDEEFSYVLDENESNILNLIAILYGELGKGNKSIEIWQKMRMNYERRDCHPVFMIREWGVISENLAAHLAELDYAEEALSISERNIELALKVGKGNQLGRNLVTIACALEIKKETCLPRFYQAARILKVMNSEYRYQVVVDMLKKNPQIGFEEDEV